MHDFLSGDGSKPPVQTHRCVPGRFVHSPPLQIFGVSSHSLMSEVCHIEKLMKEHSAVINNHQ